MTGRASFGGGALAGLRVLEVGHIISGPFCAHLFADHGAEVIKVEPPAGDDMRRWGGLYKGVGLYWPIIGRGKKSVTLDLRVGEGQAAFRELARTADVVVENFRPGTMERWGLGPEDLQADNPDLVMVRITGYGQTGPLRDRAGFGSIAEAMSGFRHLSGDPDRPPVRVGISIGDALAGTQGFIGALLALLGGHLRPGTPRGQVIDVALYEATWMYMESILPEFVKLGKVRGPSGPLLPGIAPSSVYPTSDGRWIVMGANKDTVFGRLAAAMQRPEWAAPDGRYATHLLRGEHQLELDAEIADWTRRRTVDELLDLLDKAGVPAGRIYTAPDILNDPHYRARDMVVEVADPSLGGESVPMPGVVPKLSRTPGGIRRGAPMLGEHNDEILGVLRMTPASWSR
ncbi:CaiB/BaiF CoA transferase family protein [Streptomyces brasiliensis]|uniref:Succinyl-CoA--D-citramalate CoA-transferase n=1 Tax=Streptomyces brasiliensis TaxID=1954 RepID=A0A917L258_9ACTN|nr:CoA transferase [Streptomyces brasiliensis]GGJ41207.1 succinyl-CoA--D-citramalate CoA-transferase [Streptomyces brasiliensis]